MNPTAFLQKERTWKRPRDTVPVPVAAPNFFQRERPAGEIAGNVYYLNVGILPTMNPRVFVAYQTGTIC
mgnify:FL=1